MEVVSPTLSPGELSQLIISSQCVYILVVNVGTLTTYSIVCSMLAGLTDGERSGNRRSLRPQLRLEKTFSLNESHRAPSLSDPGRNPSGESLTDNYHCGWTLHEQFSCVLSTPLPCLCSHPWAPAWTGGTHGMRCCSI